MHSAHSMYWLGGILIFLNAPAVAAKPSALALDDECTLEDLRPPSEVETAPDDENLKPDDASAPAESPKETADVGVEDAPAPESSNDAEVNGAQAEGSVGSSNGTTSKAPSNASNSSATVSQDVDADSKANVTGNNTNASVNVEANCAEAYAQCGGRILIQSAPAQPC
eukprot:g12446.t1